MSLRLDAFSPAKEHLGIRVFEIKCIAGAPWYLCGDNEALSCAFSRRYSY